MAVAQMQEITELDGMKVGDEVELKHGVIDCESADLLKYNNKTAKITCFLMPDVEGGVYFKDGLRGCRYWNITDLQPSVRR
jgi:hypothetical protein